MKKFVSILLCIIILFWFMIPVNSNALDIQGNEYPDPSLLPPDIDFSQYDYYFLTVSGTPENPSYLLYLINDNSAEKHNRLYFTVALSPSGKRLNTSEFTSFGVNTNYSLAVKSYNKSGGTWGTSTSTSNFNNFVFDTYSEFTSSYKYIIGSNCDIYSYSGSLVRSGDYDNFCSFFRGNLAGSSDKSEKPIEPTTSGGSDAGVSVSIDLSFLSDYFNHIFSLLDSLIDLLTNLLSNFKILIDVFGSSEDGNVFLHLSVIKNILVDFFNDTDTKLDEIKTEILNFERYFSEFSAVNGEIANIFSVLSGLNINITNIHNKAIEIIDITNSIKSNVSNINTNISNFLLNFPTDFDDIINSIRSNVSDINLRFSNFLLNFPTDFDDIINCIRSNVSNISVHLSNFLLNFPADFDYIINSIRSNVSNINTNLSNFLLNFSTGFDDLINHIQVSFDSLFEDISLKFESLDNSGLIDAIKAVETAVNNLPDSFEDLLVYLFVPKTKKPEELMKIINERFGFAKQFVEMSDVIFQTYNFSSDLPEYIIKFDSDLFGHFEGKIIDFSVIPYYYIQWFKLLTSGITCYFFIQKVRKRLPAIINGGASS